MSHERLKLSVGPISILFILLSALAVGAQPREGLYQPDLTVERTPHSGPRVWTIVSDRSHLVEPGTRWHIYIEETEAGMAKSGSRETPIRQTRVRVVEVDNQTATEKDIAYLEHLSNLEVAVLQPGDPRLDLPAVQSTDPKNPWPNQCGFSFVDSPLALDFDEDDRNEFALRFYATHPGTEAQGILLIEPDESGVPSKLPLSTFVDKIRAEDLHLRDITWPSGRRNAVLTVTKLSLEDCRFLSLLQIRGELNCDNCCSFPALLARGTNGKYEPIYDRKTQYPLLDRLREDITVVAGGDQIPLSSAEEAALARMASFYYLTGQGDRTAEELSRALGERANHYRTRLLLDRIDEHFLQPQSQ